MNKAQGWAAVTHVEPFDLCVPERLCKQGAAGAAAAVHPFYCQTPARGPEVSAATSQLQYQPQGAG